MLNKSKNLMNKFSIVSTILLFSSLILNAQSKEIDEAFGKLSAFEKNFTIYEKDKEANAVVLHEKGDFYFKVINSSIYLVKNYHKKTKILNDKGYDYGKVAISYYKNKDSREKITDLKAITHNNGRKEYLSASQVFKNDINERWSEKTFAFSNVQVGSILEYKYTLISPFFFNLDGWNFQSNIPKLRSEFNAKIPGNYVYNRTLIGSLKLDTNESTIKKSCFSVPGLSKAADCEVLEYIMTDIPAFKEEEDYMLAASNYISRLDFELSQYHRFDGTIDKFTKTWAAVDKEFKYDKDIGRQLNKRGFFEKNVPENLLIEGDELTRAKNIYKFIQKHFTWNNKNSTYGKARVKDAFNARVGNAWEINMALINLLKSADIKSNLVLSSTRNNGLPKRNHPVMSDFNYVLAKVEIADKSYLLDATDKLMPFGMLPYRTLNYYGRVMDFKNESYWYDIVAKNNNKNQVQVLVKFDVEAKKAYGSMNAIKFGYDAVYTHKQINEYSEDEYLNTLEDNVEGDFEITDYKFIEERSSNSRVIERLDFEIQNALEGETVYFNPILMRFFDKNPFTLEERNYPIDFGYNRKYKYQLSIEIPEGYSVYEIPKSKQIRLGENLAFLKFIQDKNEQQITLMFELNLNNSYYESDMYEGLKEMFKYATDIQKNSLLILKKN